MTENSKIAVFPGSFNPFTIGHANIVERGLKLFDHIIIAVGYNEHKPGGMDEALKRAASIASLYEDNEHVSVRSFKGLTVNFCRQAGASAILRGLRSSSDFDYEKNMADVNEEISGIPTLFLPCKPELSFVSSSMIRELEHNGYDVSKYIASERNCGKKL